MFFESINPFSGQSLAIHEHDEAFLIQQKIVLSHKTYLYWKEQSIQSKIDLLLNLEKLLRLKQYALAQIITSEMGKPISEAMMEIAKCADCCLYYAHNHQILEGRTVKTAFKKSEVFYQPLGVVLGIMPWNFPFWQVFRFAIPTLMAGNSVLLKHAPNVCLCAKAINQLFLDANFPDNLLTPIFVNEKIINKIIKHEHIKAVSLTGSEYAGVAVAKAAASVVKKSILELGGSDPFIVCNDADPVQAAKAACFSRLSNAGQSCIAAKRFIIDKSIANEFIAAFIDEVKRWPIGNPMDDFVKMGPIASTKFVSKLHTQLQNSLNKDVKLLFQADVPNQIRFFPPTILLLNKPSNLLFNDETFGPIVPIFLFNSDNQALKVANKTKYGLGAAVFTQNQQKQNYFKQNIQAGTIFINHYVKSMPEMPFGGIGLSGYGRELSQEALVEFTNCKSFVLC